MLALGNITSRVESLPYMMEEINKVASFVVIVVNILCNNAFLQMGVPAFALMSGHSDAGLKCACCHASFCTTPFIKEVFCRGIASREYFTLLLANLGVDPRNRDMLARSEIIHALSVMLGTQTCC